MIEEALEAVVERVLRRVLPSLLSPQSDADALIDAPTAAAEFHVGRRTFRRAAAAGAFPSFKRGRAIVARRGDVAAWAVAQPRALRAAEVAASRGDELDRALASGRLRVVGGAR